MWMVPPRTMCDQHLLGEHVELHMLAGTLLRRRSISGFLEKGLLEVHNLYRRHQELVSEMKRRGMRHSSPLPKVRIRRAGRVDRKQNVIELARRCGDCRRQQRELS